MAYALYAARNGTVPQEERLKIIDVRRQMKIKADLHGLNEQYRRARGTDKPFTGYHEKVWRRICAERAAERRKKEGEP